jgi:hypothetical protein
MGRTQGPTLWEPLHVNEFNAVGMRFGRVVLGEEFEIFAMSLSMLILEVFQLSNIFQRALHSWQAQANAPSRLL